MSEQFTPRHNRPVSHTTSLDSDEAEIMRLARQKVLDYEAAMVARSMLGATLPEAKGYSQEQLKERYSAACQRMLAHVESLAESGDTGASVQVVGMTKKAFEPLRPAKANDEGMFKKVRMTAITQGRPVYTVKKDRALGFRNLLMLDHNTEGKIRMQDVDFSDKNGMPFPTTFTVDIFSAPAAFDQVSQDGAYIFSESVVFSTNPALPLNETMVAQVEQATAMVCGPETDENPNTWV